jgi:hypothetical protein
MYGEIRNGSGIEMCVRPARRSVVTSKEPSFGCPAIEQVRVRIAFCANMYRRRVVGLDQRVAILIPRGGLDAVARHDVGLDRCDAPCKAHVSRIRCAGHFARAGSVTVTLDDADVVALSSAPYPTARASLATAPHKAIAILPLRFATVSNCGR